MKAGYSGQLERASERTRVCGPGVLDRPVVTALITLAGYACVVGLRWLIAAKGNITEFIRAELPYAHPGRVAAGLHVFGSNGYDGQFYYRLALDPANLHGTAFGITLDHPYRLERIGYPALAWLASLGHHKLTPIALVLVNVLALSAIGLLGGMLAVESGRHALWGLLLAGYFGFFKSLGNDLTEPVAAACLLGGVLAYRRAHPAVAGLLFAYGALTRETVVLVPLAILLVRIADAVLPVPPGQHRGGFREVVPPGQHRGGFREVVPPGQHRGGFREVVPPGQYRGGFRGVVPPGQHRGGFRGVVPPGQHSGFRPCAADLAWCLPLLVFTGWQLILRAATGTLIAASSVDDNVHGGLPFTQFGDAIRENLGLLGTSADAYIWFAEVATLTAFVVVALISLRSTTVPGYERVAFVAFIIELGILSNAIWTGHADLRSLDECYLLAVLILARSSLRRLWPLASCAAVTTLIAATQEVLHM